MIMNAIVIGIIATAFMDLIALGQRRLFGIPSLNYAMVGRWIGHLPRGRVIHRAIGHSPAIPREAVIGWMAHYLIGILFASVFLSLPGQTGHPLCPVLFGAVTVAVPFFILQPCMGAGIAARRTPSPWTARARSICAHVSFGIGLWLGTTLWAWSG